MTALQLVEIRTLDGANIFLPGPAMKLHVRAAVLDAERLASVSSQWLTMTRSSADALLAGGASTDVVAGLLWSIVCEFHRALALPLPPGTVANMADGQGEYGELTLAFGWEWRTTAEGIARAAFDITNRLLDEERPELDLYLTALRAALATDRAEDDRPLFIRAAERQTVLAAITGTNGKTTTTRCLAHLLATAGRRVGMANSNGVWLGDEQVLEGDYTGPQGARHVLMDETIDVAVLETARGGILLRGIAYENNDVGVVTNISADHLGLQGIHTVEDLARVKSLVVRLTRPDGLVVLNADDPLVRAMADVVRAPVLFFSRAPDNPVVVAHLAAEKRALLVEEGAIVLAEGVHRQALLRLTEVPITFGGRAPHMVENVLATVGAALGLGLDPVTIVAGLRTFHSSPEQNFGRLNVFTIANPACTVIVDYAHNEAGLASLLAFGQTYVAPGARLLAIIGTAGDRNDAALREIGRQAGTTADFVWVHGTEQYLRGRTRAAMDALFVVGIVEGRGNAKRGYALVPNELAAIEAALAMAHPGDVVVMMCFEEQAAVLDRLDTIGTLLTD